MKDMLLLIFVVLLFSGLFKKMSISSDEVGQLKEQLKRIADALEKE